MSEQALGYGIDFGSTNSLIAAAYADRVETLRFPDSSRAGDMDACLPTVVYFDRHEDYRAGTDAVHQFVRVGGSATSCPCNLDCGSGITADVPPVAGVRPNHRRSCADARLASGLKGVIADAAYAGTDSWGRHFDSEDMVFWVLRALRRRVDNSLQDVGVPVAFGVPVKYLGERPGGRDVALGRMQGAAQRAGFKSVSFLEEPKAALVSDVGSGTAIAGQPCVSLDFGGGTFDVAVSASGLSGWKEASTAGDAIGGESFDDLIYLNIVAPALELKDVLRACRWARSRHGMIRAAGDVARRRELASLTGRGPEMLHEILERGLVYDFWAAIEDAKIALSTEGNTSVDFHRRGVAVDVPLSRPQFEQLIEPAISSTRSLIERALAAASLDSNSVGLVVKTGGSSTIPAFDLMVREMFPAAVVQARPSLTTIVEGLAGFAAEREPAGQMSAIAFPEPTPPREQVAGEANRDAACVRVPVGREPDSPTQGRKTPWWRRMLGLD